MAVTAGWYPLALKNVFDGTISAIDWDTDTIQCSLHTSAYTIAFDTDDFWNDATNEITGTGYTTKGVTLGTKTVQYDTGSDEVRLDAADAAWTSSSFTARSAVIWKDTAGASTTDPLIGWVNFGGDETVASGTFTITWASNGVLVIDCT